MRKYLEDCCKAEQVHHARHSNAVLPVRNTVGTIETEGLGDILLEELGLITKEAELVWNDLLVCHDGEY